MFGVVYTPWSIGRCMAKGSTDLILRDRLQFTLDATGNQTTVYGRFDLSDYVNALERKGLSIKEVNFMLRDNTNGNTGNFSFSQAKATNPSNTFNLSSGTVITPILGSIVQKGKLAASAFAFDNALKSVDLPTFGNPTIPHCNPIYFTILIIEKFCSY